MRRLGAGSPWKEVLIFASVAVAVPSCVTVLGLGLGRSDAADGVPDVLTSRCLDRAPEPLDPGPSREEHRETRTKKGLIAAALIALAGTAFAHGAADEARELAPADIRFEDNPAFPKGAQSMLIHGDPAKPEFFIIRLKFPPNYVVPAHTHPAFESVTVLTGSMGSGMGRTVDTSKGRMLAAGSLLLLPANHPHYVWTEDEETIIQVAATGPFDIIYVNPEEDPRRK